MLLAKNSNGKIIATIILTQNQIYIDNYNKPMLVIFNRGLVNDIKQKDDRGIITLYDDYTLNIGEIAALYDCAYFIMNRKILSLYKENKIKTDRKAGRRNSSFGKEFTQERKNKIGEKAKGRHIPPYIRTPEIKEKISRTLKRGYKDGRIVINREGISQAWADGKFANASMGRGISGYFHSNKNGKEKDIYFRSLLELKFLLLVEEDERVYKILMEPFCLPIKEDPGSHYTPDCLINDKWLIEIKSRDHFKFTKDGINNRFEKEIKTAQEYCENNNLYFKIIYDDELDFESGNFKRYIVNHPEIIEKYNIRFNKEIKL